VRQGPRLVAALAPAAALAQAGCFVFTSAMTAAPDHDENMYVTAGVLLDELSMHSDFAFLQMPYLYRVGDLLTPEQRARVRATSPSTVGDLLRNDPPSAVLAGFEGELDAPLEAFARHSGYVKADGDFWGATL
jgi:hypothetical protein